MRWKYPFLLPALFLSGVHGLVAIGQPSVYYIQAPSFNFFMAKNMAFSLDSSLHVVKNSSICECRTLCFALDANCSAWSVVPQVDDGQDCYITDEGPETLVPFQQEEATYFFKQSSINGTYSFQADSLLYVELEELLMHQSAKTRCSSIPGHRLIIMKKHATLDYFRTLTIPDAIKPWPLLDLLKINSTYAQWGDGTSYHDTEIAWIPGTYDFATSGADVFAGFKGIPLNDARGANAGPFKIVCQSNPLGIDW